MPQSFKSARLWTLIGVLVIAALTGTALRATQGADAITLGVWTHSTAI